MLGLGLSLGLAPIQGVGGNDNNSINGSWGSRYRIDRYIDPTSGSDSNDGLSAATAKATFSAVTQSSNMVIGLKRGTVLRAATIALTSAGVKIGAYGPTSDPAPLVLLSTAISGTWANVSGNIWSISQASAPLIVALLAKPIAYAREGYTRLWRNTSTPTTPSAGQFGHSSGTLYIYSATDPNTLSVEIPNTGGGIGISLTASDQIAVDLAAWFGVSDGAYFGSSATNGVIRGCDLSGHASDGCGASVAKNIIFERNFVADVGNAARDGTGADGDGVSFHGDGGANYCSGIIRNNTFKRCRKSGLGNQTSSTIEAYNNWIEDCYWSIAMFNTPYTGGVAQVHNYYNNIIISRPSVYTASTAIVINSAMSYAFTAKINNNTLFCGAKTTGIHGIRLTETANLTAEVKNNIVQAFDRGLDVRGSATVSIDGNDMYGCNTAYFDNSTGFLTGITGAAAITSDPQFRSVSAPYDFTFPSGSPAASGGAVVNIAADYNGAPVNQASPQRGALVAS